MFAANSTEVVFDSQFTMQLAHSKSGATLEAKQKTLRKWNANQGCLIQVLEESPHCQKWPFHSVQVLHYLQLSAWPNNSNSAHTSALA